MFVIFDLDGTLTITSHRDHLFEGENPDNDAFHRASAFDPPRKEIVNVCQAIREWLVHVSRTKGRVEIWTGRKEKHRASAHDWLDRYGIYFDRLLMCPDNDERPTNDVKEGWLNDLEVKPDLVFDDRKKCVDWWRKQGIVCVDVAGNDF